MVGNNNGGQKVFGFLYIKSYHTGFTLLHLFSGVHSCGDTLGAVDFFPVTIFYE